MSDESMTVDEVRDQLSSVPPPTPTEFEEAFGEPLTRTLDLETWSTGDHLPDLYQRLESEVRDAVADEDQIRRQIRTVVFPRIATSARSISTCCRLLACHSSDARAMRRK